MNDTTTKGTVRKRILPLGAVVHGPRRLYEKQAPEPDEDLDLVLRFLHAWWRAADDASRAWFTVELGRMLPAWDDACRGKPLTPKRLAELRATDNAAEWYDPERAESRFAQYVEMRNVKLGNLIERIDGMFLDGLMRTTDLRDLDRVCDAMDRIEAGRGTGKVTDRLSRARGQGSRRQD
jgi:hypothetical protein